MADQKKGNKKKQVGNDYNHDNYNSTFTNDLFGPKDPPSPSSSTLFGSVFGPPSSMRKQDFGGQYGNAKHEMSGGNTYRGKGENSGSVSSSKYQSQTVEPCYLSSSIYYGGQEVYSPTSQTNASQSNFKGNKRNDDDNDSNNSDGASRGNWWKGKDHFITKPHPQMERRVVMKQLAKTNCKVRCCVILLESNKACDASMS